MIDFVLNRIKAIENQKRGKIHPSHVAYLDLLKDIGISKIELNNTLNQLFENNQIEVGHSINDKWIKYCDG